MPDKKAIPVTQQSMGDTQESLIYALINYFRTIPQDDFFKRLRGYLKGSGPSPEEHERLVSIICNSTKIDAVPQVFIDLLFDELGYFVSIINPTQGQLTTIGSIFNTLDQMITNKKDRNRLLRESSTYLIKRGNLNWTQKAAVNIINKTIIKL